MLSTSNSCKLSNAQTLSLDPSCVSEIVRTAGWPDSTVAPNMNLESNAGASTWHLYQGFFDSKTFQITSWAAARMIVIALLPSLWGQPLHHALVPTSCRLCCTHRVENMHQVLGSPLKMLLYPSLSLPCTHSRSSCTRYDTCPWLHSDMGSLRM